jgi:hypothetical protein
MAELVLMVGSHKPGDETAYQDGDILCAFNDKRIKSVHAQHIAHPARWDKNGDGYLDLNSLPYKVLNRIYQYRFERLSKTEVQRITIATSEVEDVSDQMDVDLFIRRRRPAWLGAGQRGLALFSAPGAEVWFGGKVDWSGVDNVWDDIEADTDKRKADHTYFPLTDTELGNFLGLAVDDMSDEAAADLVAPEMEGEGEEITTVKKRKNMVSWKDIAELSGGSIAEIETPGHRYEVRNEGVHAMTDLVVGK